MMRLDGKRLTMPVNQRLDQLAAVELVVVVSVVHFEVVELQLLISHLAGIDRNVHVLRNMPKMKVKVRLGRWGYWETFTLFPFQDFLCGKLVDHDVHVHHRLRAHVHLHGLVALVQVDHDLLEVVAVVDGGQPVVVAAGAAQEAAKEKVQSSILSGVILPPAHLLLMNHVSILIDILNGNLLMRLILLGIHIGRCMLVVVRLRGLILLLISRLFLQGKRKITEVELHVS
jgi:hypothetical protein